MNPENQNQQQAIAQKITESKNILVTVSTNPSVDQLAACLGLTIWLNKIDKHATAVFSGEVPSTLEFLQPADTLEKNTDSLRDFIISLDKNKADKLRYKVEDSVVKVFVTPYRTSLSVDDLEFSQGDFNVDLVIALGVHRQDELDSAITAHGRILHDATVATVTIGEASSELGSINWHDGQASSLSELVVETLNIVDQSKIDGQIATALLTGVVAETARFSNAKTTPQTMNLSAQLMAAGANQQLVATKLDEQVSPKDNATESTQSTESDDEPLSDEPTPENDGSIQIGHDAPIDEPAQFDPEPYEPQSPPEPAPEQPDEQLPIIPEPAEAHPQIHMPEPPQPDELAKHEEKVIEPLPGQMQAFQPPPNDWLPPQAWMPPQSDAQLPPEPLAPPESIVLPEPVPEPPQQPELPPIAAPEPPHEQTLADLERDVHAARDQVEQAINTAPDIAPTAVQSLNALPIELGQPTQDPVVPIANTAFDPAAFSDFQDAVPPPPAIDPDLTTPVQQPYTLPLPQSLTPPAPNPVPPTSVAYDPSAPPPVPPPMPFNQQ